MDRSIVREGIMLTEERHALILEHVNANKTVSLAQLCELLDTSESTVRRDLALLDQNGMLIKVRGGAMALGDRFSLTEQDMAEKSKLFNEEKTAIAKFAAQLIDEDDFVFIDAGTTTEKMIDFIPQKNVTFVTNAFIHAKKLAQRGFRVLLPAGEIKLTTEALVGAECVNSLRNYNFSKCFLGANGISLSGGVSTPDMNEASVKSAVISGSREVYLLADHSKFDQTSSVTFARLNQVRIITDKLSNKRYFTAANVKEVL